MPPGDFTVLTNQDTAADGHHVRRDPVGSLLGSFVSGVK